MASVFVLLEAFNRKEAAALGFFPCATASSSPADELQANLIADTEWFMRNQILMEYITELFQKNYKR